MLFARRAVAEVAVVRKIHQHIRARLGELADQIGEGRFVADERADPVAVQRKGHDARAGDEIADFMRDAIHPAKGIRHVLAKRDQFDLVVALRRQFAIGFEQECRVERIARRCSSHAPHQDRSLGVAREIAHVFPERCIGRIERRGSFGPHDQRRVGGLGEQDHALFEQSHRLGSPLGFGVDVRLDDAHPFGSGVRRRQFRQQRQHREARLAMRNARVCVTGLRRTASAIAHPIIASTNDNPHTPVIGARRGSSGMSMAAFPRSSQANPSPIQARPMVPCAYSTAVQSAAAPGIAQGVRMT